MKSNLRIAINAQVSLGTGAGGVETVLRTLASLGRLDGEEEYIFIGHWSDADWLKPLLNERQTLVQAPSPKEYKSIVSENFRRSLGALRPLARKVKRAFAPPPKTQITIPVSNGFYENLGCDVIHFPYQKYVLCSTPTVYNPHDLQHLHYPQFFSREEISKRETIYPGACRAARVVVVASEFVKQDVMRNYGIEADKIQVIPWSPPEMTLEKTTKEEARLLSEKYEISDAPFALYPAITWEHKNHIRLLEAIARLRDGGDLKVNLICTGQKNSFFSEIERRLQELKLEKQVKFLGVVSYKELSNLYLRAQFVIIPTLFEAASAPLFEAWQRNVAVACSSVTSLPEQSDGAALLFNPFSIEEIADTLKKMSLDESLRAELRAKGTSRLRNFSLDRTLKAYRAVYRKAAGLKLNDEDRDLLSRDWMSERNISSRANLR
ncbi:MAG TPA: glycosyltransferase family 1 protein [Pyrinomonadaceae bacterium]|nr:glycosyltransferase family 1 protein [Pyrinomonadaceae bacterium]